MPTEAEYEARIGALDWDGLQALWGAIESRDTPDWEPGRAFEYLVLRRFNWTAPICAGPTRFSSLRRTSSRLTAPYIALAHFALPQDILLWEGEEIAYVLQQKKACDLLLLKHRACVEGGLPDYNVRERSVG